MTTPTSGPTRTVYDFTGLYKLQDKWRQKRPFTLELPYNFYQSKLNEPVKWALPASHRAVSYAWTPDGVIGGAPQKAAADLAYERFKGALSDSASFGENLFEFEKSLSTIETKAKMLAMAFRDIRRKDFKSAWETVWWSGSQKTHIHPIKQGASNWLEFHLGIAPVIGDVYSAIDLLQNPIKGNVRTDGKPPALTIKGRAKSKSYSAQDWKPFITTRYWDVDIFCQYQAEVSVSNPNLWLANRMGVLNPVQVAWQLVPFSFVADWFVNVEAFLGSFTDLFGLTVQKASTTTFFNGISGDCQFSPGNQYGWTYQFGTSQVTGVRRVTGIDTPGLHVRAYKVPGWQRALTAVSLLTGNLHSLNRQLPSRKSWGYGGSM